MDEDVAWTIYSYLAYEGTSKVAYKRLCNESCGEYGDYFYTYDLKVNETDYPEEEAIVLSNEGKLEIEPEILGMTDSETDGEDIKEFELEKLPTPIRWYFYIDGLPYFEKAVVQGRKIPSGCTAEVDKKGNFTGNGVPICSFEVSDLINKHKMKEGKKYRLRSYAIFETVGLSYQTTLCLDHCPGENTEE